MNPTTDPTPPDQDDNVIRLTHVLRNESLAQRIVDHATESRIPIGQLIAEALSFYAGMTPKQKQIHDYTPRPAHPVTFWLDDPNYNRLLGNAQKLGMSRQHYAYFAICRYMMIDEKLEVVEVKTGPKTKTKRIRNV